MGIQRNALLLKYISSMKSATLPPVRVDNALRDAAEAVLADGESLSAFIESSVRRAVEYRQVQAAFLARGQASLKEYLSPERLEVRARALA